MVGRVEAIRRRIAVLALAALAIVLLAGPAVAGEARQEGPVSTGSSYQGRPAGDGGEVIVDGGSPGAQRPGSPAAQRPDVPTYRVLWDLSHGPGGNYIPSVYYSDLVLALGEVGMTVETTVAGVENVTLDDYDVLVVNVMSANGSAYTAGEANAIKGFVDRGGGLMLMCDAPTVSHTNVQPVAGAFGIFCAVSLVADGDVDITDFAAKPYTDGITRIVMTRPGEVTVPPEGAQIARSADGKWVVSQAYGVLGTVVVTGDVNLWINQSIGSADNRLFGKKVFHWLAERHLHADPAAVRFELEPGQSASSGITFWNPGGHGTDYSISVATGGSEVAGDWMLFYDWGCDGGPTATVLTLSPDHTFVDSFGEGGTWTQSQDEVTWTFSDSSSCSYTGYIAGRAMAGKMYAPSVGPGCWEARRMQPGKAMPTVAGAERTASGAAAEGAVAQGAETAPLRNDAAAQGAAAGRAASLPTPPGLRGRVLWDLAHGVFLDYEPAGSYSDVVGVLAEAGYVVETTTAGLDQISLDGYDAVVVGVLSAWDTEYTPGEVSAIQAFVGNGGGLLVLCGETNLPNANVQPVASAFGITCGVSDAGTIIDRLARHAIFRPGVYSLSAPASGEVTAALPEQLVGREAASGKGLIAVAEPGSGRVAVMGDANSLDNSALSTRYNAWFAERLFDWLIQRWLTLSPTTNTLWSDAAGGVVVHVVRDASADRENGLLIIRSGAMDEALAIVPVGLLHYHIALPDIRRGY